MVGREVQRTHAYFIVAYIPGVGDMMHTYLTIHRIEIPIHANINKPKYLNERFKLLPPSIPASAECVRIVPA